jgi:hypothetical protein
VKTVTYLDKLFHAMESPAYQEYSNLIGAAIARAAMGDPSARNDLNDLMKEQAQFVRSAMDQPS